MPAGVPAEEDKAMNPVADQGPWPPAAAAELPTATPNRSVGFRVRRDLGVRMRDGVRLSANVFFPDDDAPAPVVLIRQPYGKDDHPGMWARGKYWARKGYVCVIQDVRGKFGSEGEWYPFVHEADDGWDTLDWVAAQPWCNGAIGMAGESYHGYTQWAVAASGHPNLRCLAPGDTSPDPYLIAYQGGALNLGVALWAWVMESREIADPQGWRPWHLPLATLDEAMGRRSPMLQEVLRHPEHDEYWDRADTTPSLGGVRIPVLHWGGWFDFLLRGTLRGWRHTAVARAAGADHRLIVGPTDHALIPAAYGGGAAAADSPGAWCFDRVQRFFDRWLRGDEQALAGLAPVSIYIMGAERWREAQDWPLPGTRIFTYYLHSGGGANTMAGDGRLDATPPGEEPADTFVYDPASPVDVWLAESAWDLTWTIKDRAAVEARPDVLVYTTAALAADLEVAGPLTVTLSAASSAPDTDFAATLVDVFPDGATALVQEGLIRARYREPGGGARPLTPEAVHTFTIDLAATGYLFARGHRLRLEVTSSIFGRHDRNPNSGGPFGLDTMGATARQTVHHSQAHPSYISLPVIPAETGAAALPAATPNN